MKEAAAKFIAGLLYSISKHTNGTKSQRNSTEALHFHAFAHYQGCFNVVFLALFRFDKGDDRNVKYELKWRKVIISES